MSQPISMEKRDSMTHSLRRFVAIASGVAITVCASGAFGAAERSGKEVVDSACASCHASGAKGAPKIGDQKAWLPLAMRGLDSLTEAALKGVRNMPAHGGNMSLSDVEIERGIIYMINLSGGKWIEPVSGVTPAVQRKGKQIVDTQCGKCHQEGKGGAPKIGDRTDWIPRLRYGIDVAVRSAINGHGPMPARGGLPDLTDPEIRAAVNYMVNPRVVTEQKSAESIPDSNRKIVDGMEVYFGIVSAESLKGSREAKLHGGIPEGKDYYHVNISLFDAKTRAAIGDAQVEVQVSEPVSGGETKKLDAVTIGGTKSYGHYFRLASKNPYTVTVRIVRPGKPRTLEAKFDYKRY
jgi:cytochrome c5